MMAAYWVAVVCVSATPLPGRSPLPTVTVDMTGLDERAFERLAATSLYKSLVLRLVEERLAFVDDLAAADLVVQLLSAPSAGWRIVVRGEHGQREQTLQVDGLPTSQSESTLVLAVLTLVREVRALPPPVPMPAVMVPPTIDHEPPTKVLFGAELGWLSSGGDSGLFGELLIVEASIPTALRGVVRVQRPITIDARLDLWEWALGGGVAWARPMVGAWLKGVVTLDGGLVWQRYRFDDATLGRHRGDLFDMWLRPALALVGDTQGKGSFTLSAGLFCTAHETVHRTAHTVIWRAKQWRPELGVGYQVPL